MQPWSASASSDIRALIPCKSKDDQFEGHRAPTLYDDHGNPSIRQTAICCHCLTLPAGHNNTSQKEAKIAWFNIGLNTAQYGLILTGSFLACLGWFVSQRKPGRLSQV